jgi:flavin-dependent dehydrogenase
LARWRIRTPTVDEVGTFGGAAHALGVSRKALDAALLGAARDAGVEVQEGVRVTGVQAAGAGRSRPSVALTRDGVARDVRPRMVVGADGIRSAVVRSLGLIARRPRLRKVSATAHVTGSGLPVGEGLLHVADGVTLGVAPVGAGVWNATAVGDAAAVGAALRAGTGDFLMDLLRSRLHEGADLRLLDGPWTSGPFDWPVRRAWAPGVVLVGDAAGYYDPFTGQGIYRALRSAEMAALAAHEVMEAAERGPAPQDGDGAWSGLARYDRRWRRAARLPVLVQRGIEGVISRPGLRDLLLPALGATGALDEVVRVTGDLRSG